LPDGKVRAEPKIVERLQHTFSHWSPTLVYVTHPHEMHADHRAAARIVAQAISKDALHQQCVAVRQYEIWTPLSSMDDIIDISEYVDRKRAAIEAHKSQCEVMRFSEAALALNRYRGEYHSWPGGDYAEVFQRMQP
jgi:LmbE family N-acetylglucosaminyl deacetylase